MNARGSFRIFPAAAVALAVLAAVTLPGSGGAQLPKEKKTCVWQLPPTSVVVDHFEVKVLELDDDGVAVDSTTYVTPHLESPYEFDVELAYRGTYQFRVRSITAGGDISEWSGLSSKHAPDSTLVAGSTGG